MATYKELLAQKEALQSEIDTAMAAAKDDAVAQARAIVDEYQLDELTVFGRSISRDQRHLTKAPVLVKYKDPVTAKTWTGRGKPPTWIVGKDRAAFAV